MIAMQKAINHKHTCTDLKTEPDTIKFQDCVMTRKEVIVVDKSSNAIILNSDGSFLYFSIEMQRVLLSLPTNSIIGVRNLISLDGSPPKVNCCHLEIAQNL